MVLLFTIATWKRLQSVIFAFSTPGWSVSNFGTIGRYRNLYCFNIIATWKGLDSVIFEFSTPVLVSVSNFSAIGRYRYFYCFNTIATWKGLGIVIFKFSTSRLVSVSIFELIRWRQPVYFIIELNFYCSYTMASWIFQVASRVSFLNSPPQFYCLCQISAQSSDIDFLVNFYWFKTMATWNFLGTYVLLTGHTTPGNIHLDL